MHRFMTDQRPSSTPPSGIPIDFYRDELIRHQCCLRRQREYYSELAYRSPSGRWRGCCRGSISCADRRTPPQVMGHLLRQFDIVTNLSAWSDPKTGELTVDLARFRRDLPAIFRAALDRSSASALLESALHRPDVRRFLARPLRVLSIGKAASHLAVAFDRLCPGAAVGRAGRRHPPRGCAAVGGHLDRVESPRAGRPERGCGRAGAGERARAAARARAARPAVGRRVGARGAAGGGHHARGQAGGDAAAARGRRRHPRSERGSQAPVGRQGRAARGGRRGPRARARDLGRRRATTSA